MITKVEEREGLSLSDIGGMPVPSTFEGDMTFAKLQSRVPKLVKFSVMNNGMMKAANNSPEKLQHLIDWGGNARIAHQVFIETDAKLSTKFDNNVNITLSAGVDKLVKATGRLQAKRQSRYLQALALRIY